MSGFSVRSGAVLGVAGVLSFALLPAGAPAAMHARADTRVAAKFGLKYATPGHADSLDIARDAAGGPTLATEFDGEYFGPGKVTATGDPTGAVTVPWASGGLPDVIVSGGLIVAGGGAKLKIRGTARAATATAIAVQNSGLGLVTVTYHFSFRGNGPPTVKGTFGGHGTDQAGSAVTYSGSFTATKRRN